jgi:hypothetical protein
LRSLMNIASTHSPNFLQASSGIIGKHRYRSDVTGMTNINSSLSSQPAINQTPQVSFWAAPKPRLNG